MDGYDLSQIPAVSPPAGVVSNFVNPPTQEQWPKITTYVTLPLVVLSLALRLYARSKVTGFGFDDYLCFSAAASVIVYIALAFRVIEQAAGPHMWDIPVSKITVSYAKNTTTLALMYFVAAMFIKASLLALYKRIFRPSKQANRVLWGGIIVSTIFHITCIAVYLGLCLPRPEDEASGGWLSPQFAARTYSVEGALSAASGIIAAVIDLFILVTPLWLLWKLHMPSKRKAGVSIIFVAGSAACVFSIAGAVYRMKISSPTAEGQDLSWNVMPIYAMNIAEVNIGIVCSCMPVVFILFRGLSARSANWSATWISKIRNLTTSRRRTSAPSDGSEVQIFDDQSIEPKVLPGEPQVIWKEPKSCGHNLSRITSIPAHDIPPELLTVNSTEGDYYHAHLRRDAVPHGSH